MNTLRRLSYFSLLSLLLICSASVSAQWEKKPSTEWTNDDIKKVLNDSPWVKKVDFFGVGQAGYPGGGFSNQRSKVGNDPNIKLDPSIPSGRMSGGASTTVYVRLLSAKPILEAIKQNKVFPQGDGWQFEELKALANSSPGELIIIGVGRRILSSPYESTLGTGVLSPDITKETYLEVKGGPRIPLYEYKSGRIYTLSLGIFFVFKRVVDGKPIIIPDSGEFRFHTKIQSAGKLVDLEVKYKVKDLLYEGKQEF